MSRYAQAARMDAYVLDEAKADPFIAAFKYTREETLGHALSDWISAYERDKRFGLKSTARMDPMDGEAARITRELVSRWYWRGTISRSATDAARAEIARASESYFVRGKIDHTPSKNKVKDRLRAKILERDGPDCWLCGAEMPSFDRTIEHLLARSLGGTNALDNLRLTHTGCNVKLGVLSVEKKLRLRSKLQGITQ